MYPLNTELGRIEPQSTEDEVDPFDRIRIVAPSPIKKASHEDWAGSAASDHYIVTPLAVFGSNEVMSFDYLQANYTVTKYGDEEPPVKIELDKRRESLRQRPSPEQVFAAEARKQSKSKKAATA